MSKEKTPVQLIIDAIEAVDLSNASVDVISTAHFIKTKAESIRDNQEMEALKDALTDGFHYDYTSHNKHRWYEQKYGNHE